MGPNKRYAVALWLLMPALGCLVAVANELLSVGRGIYLSGALAHGTSVSALTQRDVALPAAAAACATCHRRSGLGGSEGTAKVPPITAAALFAPRAAAPTRSAYTERSLIRAITSGIDANGRLLDSLMPRYALDPNASEAIAAYLRQLGPTNSPGVSDDKVHLATVIADDAPAGAHAAIERVLMRYFQIKNGGSRRELERAAAARRHPNGSRADRAFRIWTLAIWRLHGPSSTWTSQLRQLELEQAPFALLSGATGADWQVVHEFCEQRGIPCILPIAEPPVTADGDFYSLYFSPGVHLDARVTANHLARRLPNKKSKVAVFRRGDTRSDSAWSAFRTRWRELGFAEPSQEIVIGDVVTAVRASANREIPEAMVLWLDPQSLAKATSALSGLRRLSPVLYTAESFTDLSQLPVPLSVGSRIRHVYPYSLPNTKGASFARERVWLQGQGLGDLDVRLAGQALFACHVVGEQLAGIGNNFSREYFLEGLEHMLDGAPMTSLFPRTSLGPQQRFLSRGAYIVGKERDGLDARNATWVDM